MQKYKKKGPLLCLHSGKWLVINSGKVCVTGQVKSLDSRLLKEYFESNKLALPLARLCKASEKQQALIGNSNVTEMFTASLFLRRTLF